MGKIFASGELARLTVVKDFLITAQNGARAIILTELVCCRYVFYDMAVARQKENVRVYIVALSYLHI